MIANPYYQPSGKWSINTIPTFLFIGLPMSTLWAFLYAYGLFYIPVIIFNILLIMVVAVLMGRIDGVLVIFYGKIRNEKIAFILGVVAVAFFMHSHWTIWVDLVLRHDPEIKLRAFAQIYQNAHPEAVIPALIWHPVDCWAYMIDILQIGTWGITNDNVTGGWLILFWVLESAFFFSTVPFNFRDRAKRPFCETENRWFELDELVPMNVIVDQADFVEKLEKGDYSPLREMRQVDNRLEHSQLILFHTRRGEEYYVTIKNRKPKAAKHSGDDITYDEHEIIRNIRVDTLTGKSLRFMLPEN